MTDTTAFSLDIRVPYGHVDQMGFVYYANYLLYFEMLRSEMLRQVDCPYTELEARGILLPVLQSHIDYTQPANYDDLIQVEATCHWKGIRLRVDYRVTRNDELLATGHTVHVCMNRKGRAVRPDPTLRAALQTAAS
jgi:acyl-CoA thioester hydrolase